MLYYADVFDPVSRGEPDQEEGKEKEASAGLVAKTTTLQSRSAAYLSKFGKVIEVRCESDAALKPPPDISVNMLGELRALTICSFALLKKRQ